MTTDQDGVTRLRVARRDTLSDGEMTQLKAGEIDILLARVGDDYYAVSAYCSHYGARCRCP